MILKHILVYNDTCKISPPPINPVKQHAKFKEGDICFLSCENFIAHPFLRGLWEMFFRNFFLNMDFGAFWCIF